MKRIPEQKIRAIEKALKETTLTFAEIGRQFSVSSNKVGQIKKTMDERVSNEKERKLSETA